MKGEQEENIMGFTCLLQDIVSLKGLGIWDLRGGGKESSCEERSNRSGNLGVKGPRAWLWLWGEA